MGFHVKFSDKTYRMPVKFDADTAVSADNTAAATFEMIDEAINAAFSA